jgi:atypical dual specificity phosphatase
MIGRPGSGKSWLAGALARRTKCVLVSGDEDGRAACERAASQAAALPDDTLFVLDRCNPTAAERAAWLALLPPAVAVYFDYPPALCAARMDARIGHPIRAGRGGNALAQMHRLMQPPHMREGWAGILRVSSFPAARDAALLLGGRPPLLKFPRTPHLLNLGAATPDDLVAHGDIAGPACVEEKLDGANMGLSLSWEGRVVAQNRSHWVSSASAPQFRALDGFLAAHDAALRRILGRDALFPERYILYGEWMAARHSVHYDALPALFVAFDLYDRAAGAFASRDILERTLRGSGIAGVPLLRRLGDGERLARDDVLRMLQETSAYGAQRREGVYVRFEGGGRTTGRGKVVRGDFIAGDTHWGRGPLVLNRVARLDVDL